MAVPIQLVHYWLSKTGFSFNLATELANSEEFQNLIDRQIKQNKNPRDLALKGQVQKIIIDILNKDKKKSVSPFNFGPSADFSPTQTFKKTKSTISSVTSEISGLRDVTDLFTQTATDPSVFGLGAAVSNVNEFGELASNLQTNINKVTNFFGQQESRILRNIGEYASQKAGEGLGSDLLETAAGISSSTFRSLTNFSSAAIAQGVAVGRGVALLAGVTSAPALAAAGLVGGGLTVVATDEARSAISSEVITPAVDNLTLLGGAAIGAKLGFSFGGAVGGGVGAIVGALAGDRLF